MQREDITYFGAGPAALPTEVLADAAVALQNYNETGLYVTSAFPAGVQLPFFFFFCDTVNCKLTRSDSKMTEASQNTAIAANTPLKS